METVNDVQPLIQKGNRYCQEMEFLAEAETLAEMLNNYYDSNVNSRQLIEQIHKMSVISSEIGIYTKAMKLWNKLEKVEKTQFFFPTKYFPKSDYKGYILLISHELTRTGAPVVLQDMAKILQKNGYFVVMLSPYDGVLREEICQEGIPVIVNKHLEDGRFQKKQDLKQFWTADIFMDVFDAAVFCTVILHNAVARYQEMGKPILWWLHEGRVSMEVVRGCLPAELASNVHVAYVCEYVKERLEEIEVFYEGCVLNYGVRDTVKTSNADDNGKIVFISVATIDERKGQDIFLEAIGLLPLHYLTKAEFWFVGKKTDNLICDKLMMAEKGYQNIKVWGELPREQVLKLYEECDCIVCSSRDDPLPVVITEMMILNRPCICSDHTGTSYYIEDGINGFVFENENAQQLCEKMMYVIDHKNELETIGKAGRKIYEEHLSMEIFEKNLLELMEQLKG